MKKFGKSFLMIVVLLCMFSYMGVVNAESLQSKEAASMNAVYNLLTGKALSDADKETITKLKLTYPNLYYNKVEIPSDVYTKYKNQDSTASKTISDLIEIPSSDQLTEDNGWTSIPGTQVSYSNLKYDSSNPTGYLVALAAVTSDNVVYGSKNVFQATSATTLATYSSIANTGDSGDETEVEKQEAEEEEEPEVDKEEAEEEDVDKEEQAESNPETGISDYAVYLVPLALVAGSALYLRRRVA